MIVYTKRSRQASPRRMAQALSRRVSDARSLGEARLCLIAAGQLEQALCDSAHPDAAMASAATRLAARMALDARAGRSAGTGELQCALVRLAAQLDDRPVEVRTPEGFAWYALYPEAYAATAERWIRAQSTRPSAVCVVGLRSIGTTLAAIVAEALERCGIAVADCLTVRTSGPPFARTAELPEGFAPADRCIAVDEGPGLSGSSLTAVAEALLRAGARADSIVFFAGHAQGPGAAGSASTRLWWTPERVWATELRNTDIAGLGLSNALAVAGTTPASPLDTQAWCARAGLTKVPCAVAPSQETPKMLARSPAGFDVVLKFAGLAPNDDDLTAPEVIEHRRLQRLADAGLTIAPLGAAHGWIGMPWLEGRRLTVADGDEAFVAQRLAPYIAAAAGPVLTATETAGAAARVVAAVQAWADASGYGRAGDSIARDVAHIALASAGMPAAGDGRLAPHEWIRLDDGRVLKLDAGGHDADHTWVGRQPLVWDLAGATVEWSLDGRRRDTLRQEMARRTGGTFSPSAEAFHRAGYSVFRLALARHGAAATRGEKLQQRLIYASRRYERALRQALFELERLTQ